MNDLISTLLLTIAVMSPVIVLELVCDYIQWRNKR